VPELAKQDIICFGSQDWASHWCTPQQTMSRLARHNRVLYIEPFRSAISKKHGFTKRIRLFNGCLHRIEESLWVYSPPTIAIPFKLCGHWPYLQRFNTWLITRITYSLQQMLDFSNPIHWVYQVTCRGAPLFKQSHCLVYDCIDEWAGAASTPQLHDYVATLDDLMCRDADILFVGSQSLLAPRHELNTHTHLVPQGVDLSIFAKAAQADTPWPEDIAALPQPVVGLIGVLDTNRIDVDLLCYIADQRPHISIALIGPVWQGLRVHALEAHANIHLLGNKPREQLGNYLAALDVCMLPYLVNAFTGNIYPLKLNEYLASGKPFVSTAIPACSEYPQLIRIASSHEAFLAALDQALTEDDATLQAERISVAAQNDWDKRVQQKSAIVAECLASKHTHSTNTVPTQRHPA